MVFITTFCGHFRYAQGPHVYIFRHTEYTDSHTRVHNEKKPRSMGQIKLVNDKEKRGKKNIPIMNSIRMIKVNKLQIDLFNLETAQSGIECFVRGQQCCATSRENQAKCAHTTLHPYWIVTNSTKKENENRFFLLL